MNHVTDQLRSLTRRYFFGQSGLGAAALFSLLRENNRCLASDTDDSARARRGEAVFPHHASTAKRVIYLFQSGGPSQLDLFDYKPSLNQRRDQDLPDDIRQGQRFTGMTSTQERFPLAPSIFQFRQHGSSGAWISELMPQLSKHADELCFIKSMHTSAINHDPAITFFQTGFQLAGRPSIGSWLAYGLGSENEDLPAFIALTSGAGDQPLYDRLWGSGFLPTRFQGVKFRSQGDPVLYLSNPPGWNSDDRRLFVDQLAQLNRARPEVSLDPEVETRIAQYEMAFRMQTSVPELVDFSNESQSTLDLYGPDVLQRGSFAFNCLLARRLAERDVRFVQLFHRGWDQHTQLPRELAKQCAKTDQPVAALLHDLKRTGLLEDTLVVWGGEFGRTVYCQGKLTADDYGRDHHPRCFTMWMAGGGVKPGMSYGATDDFSYNIVENPVHVHDLHATILHVLGLDHRRLTYKFQGRHYRLTDVHGEVVKPLLA
ncbi:MAG: DUF1501 domain-containing protein [Pirellula sp.]